MEYTEDELIDTIRQLDEEIEALTEEVKVAETRAVGRTDACNCSYYDAENEPTATLEEPCSVCGVQPLTFIATDAQKKRKDVRFSIDPDGSGGCTVTVCDVTADETYIEFPLDEEMTAWFGNVFLDVRNMRY